MVAEVDDTRLSTVAAAAVVSPIIRTARLPDCQIAKLSDCQRTAGLPDARQLFIRINSRYDRFEIKTLVRKTTRWTWLLDRLEGCLHSLTGQTPQTSRTQRPAEQQNGGAMLIIVAGNSCSQVLLVRLTPTPAQPADPSTSTDCQRQRQRHPRYIVPHSESPLPLSRASSQTVN